MPVEQTKPQQRRCRRGCRLDRRRRRRAVRFQHAVSACAGGRRLVLSLRCRLASVVRHRAPPLPPWAARSAEAAAKRPLPPLTEKNAFVLAAAVRAAAAHRGSTLMPRPTKRLFWGGVSARVGFERRRPSFAELERQMLDLNALCREACRGGKLLLRLTTICGSAASVLWRIRRTSWLRFAAAAAAGTSALWRVGQRVGWTLRGGVRIGFGH